MRKPPQALKSPILAFVVRGRMKPALTKRRKKTINCGTGIYGSLESGMTGDASILISKSILDFFTAMIFSCSLGYIVSMIAIPQFIVFFLLFVSAGFISAVGN